MKPYKLVLLVLWDAQLKAPTFASHGFRKVYVETRKGNNT
jgi:hypothetical protein